MNLAAIILAAGRSSRFEDGHKLLADFRGKPILEHVLELARDYPLADRVVITGAERGRVEALAQAANLRTVHNPAFLEGFQLR